MALVFDKPSTRTRVSFETGVFELGGHPLILREGELQLPAASRRATPRSCSSGWCTRSAIRTGPHETVEELARWSSVPVINMLTHEHHPCQVLADLMTLLERFGTLEGLKLAYVGDGNNMTRSLLLGGAIAGVEVAVATPPELSLPEAPGIDPAEAVRGAHAIYTDVWVSMGDEEDAERRRALLAPYRSTPSSWRRHATTRSSSTACRPIRARRSPPTCSTASARPSGTRQRTACTRRRRCSSCCWRVTPDPQPSRATVPAMKRLLATAHRMHRARPRGRRLR